MLPIVEKVGDLFGIGKGSNLYKYLNKENKEYIEKSEAPIAIKNFTAFVFNPNDIEKLQKYIEEKNLIKPYYAFAFFGIYNGFASLSKDFTNILVDSQRLQIIYL